MTQLYFTSSLKMLTSSSSIKHNFFRFSAAVAQNWPSAVWAGIPCFSRATVYRLQYIAFIIKNMLFISIQKVNVSSVACSILKVNEKLERADSLMSRCAWFYLWGEEIYWRHVFLWLSSKQGENNICNCILGCLLLN